MKVQITIFKDCVRLNLDRGAFLFLRAIGANPYQGRYMEYNHSLEFENAKDAQAFVNMYLPPHCLQNVFSEDEEADD
jgi:hypothetical protein